MVVKYKCFCKYCASTLLVNIQKNQLNCSKIWLKSKIIKYRFVAFWLSIISCYSHCFFIILNRRSTLSSQQDTANVSFFTLMAPTDFGSSSWTSFV